MSLPGEDEGASRLQEANAELQSRIEEEQAARREERFLWLICVLALVDMLAFRGSDDKVVPIIVTIFELLVLFVLARRLGIRNIVRALDRVLDAVAGEAKPKDG